MPPFASSQAPAEAVLLPHSGGTRGHKGDAVLQCDRGRLPVRAQERSEFPAGDREPIPNNTLIA